MSAAPVGRSPLATQGPVVWGGRTSADVPDSLDDWSTSRSGLHRRLREAGSLVVLDALSFPWQVLDADERALPTCVALPDDLDATSLGQLLGVPLLTHLTPYDRLVGPRREVRAALQEEWHLPPTVWAEAPPSPADALPPGARGAKLRHLQLSSALVEEARAATADVSEAGARIHVRGDASAHRSALVRAFGATAAVTGPELDDPPSPHVVAVVLPDGADADEVAAQALSAREVLHPGGRVVLAAHVVTAPGGPANISTSACVEALSRGFGTMVHVDRLRSLRLVGEPWSRVVVMTLTSLWPRPE
ncbi:hypothetical protein [Nocardioides perillae]|uniref:Uncharacterized protein n=1 Tax=Nocardioides perillae TaxID=1119534 RepID=A0A7Y9RX20_9ACTN|nr:hypothetical protein [Nocardioides perillae]NYG56869.1 hypothetical protein [Nocardioides perillae]